MTESRSRKIVRSIRAVAVAWGDIGRRGEASATAGRWTVALLLFIVVFSFFLRVWFGYDDVFTGDAVRFRGNDPWYHMRLVDSVVHHFPHRITYDPYLRFPGGQEVDVAPLFDLMIGFTVIVIGAGAPSAETIDTVAAFVPPALGALIPVFVYLLGRRLFSPTAGLFAAALVGVFPGALFLRSLLGYVDHHVLEVLLSTIVAWLLVAACQARRRRARTVLAGAAGLVLTAYLATWRGGGLFVLVLVGATVAHLQLDQFRGRFDHRTADAVSTALLVALGGVAALFYALPTVELHLVALAGGVSAILATWAVSRILTRRGSGPRTCTMVSVAATAFMVAAVISVLMGVGALREQLAGAYRAYGVVPVIEATPLFGSLRPWHLVLFDEFTMASLLAPMALVPVAVAAWRGAWADTLLVTWFAVMSIATVGQVRYAYYLVVPVALLAGLCCERILAVSGRRQEAVFLALAVLVFVPNVQLARARASLNSGPSADWRETLNWVRSNTPEPFGDPSVYYDRYDELSAANPHPLSGSAYGVMSWWDPGYWIVRIGRRVPNANPTQTNVGYAAAFFVARREDAAGGVLDRLGSRYVIVDSAMPVRLVGAPDILTGQFHAMARTAAGPEGLFYEIYHRADAAGNLVPVLLYYPAYYETMMSRLYAFGGAAYRPQGSTYVVVYAEQRGPDGGPRKIINELRPFATYEDAVAFAEGSEDLLARVVGVDPLESCVPLAPLRNLALVHRSPNRDPTARTPAPGGQPALVQVFEYRNTGGG